MKASLFMTVYNKGQCLPNTLYSISIQRTSSPFEVCIVDNGSDVDPGPIVRKFLPDAKYLRLGRIPWVFTLCQCLGMMDPESDVIILQGADVMLLQNDIVEGLCDAVQSKRPTFAEVRNVSIGPTVWEGFDYNMPGIMEAYEEAQETDIYSGSKRPGGDWLFFLGAMLKEDWFTVGLKDRCCDVVTLFRMKEEGFDPIFLDDLKAIHQKHAPAHGWPCPLVDSCEYWCMRKMEGTR